MKLTEMIERSALTTLGMIRGRVVAVAMNRIAIVTTAQGALVPERQAEGQFTRGGGDSHPAGHSGCGQVADTSVALF